MSERPDCLQDRELLRDAAWWTENRQRRPQQIDASLGIQHGRIGRLGLAMRMGFEQRLPERRQHADHVQGDHAGGPSRRSVAKNTRHGEKVECVIGGR